MIRRRWLAQFLHLIPPSEAPPNGNKQLHNSACKRPQPRQDRLLKGSVPELDRRNRSGVFRRMDPFSVQKMREEPGNLFQLPPGRPSVRFLEWVPICGLEAKQDCSIIPPTQARTGLALSRR